MSFQFPEPGSNPYCGTTGSEFAQPEVICPPDKDYIIDEACVSACYESYQTGMVAAYDQACKQYDVIAIKYDDCVFKAMEDYDSCMAGAMGQQSQARCKKLLLSRIDLCVMNFLKDKNAVANNLTAAINSQKVTFQECAKLCCKAKI